jgi:hypothetical protein
MWEAGHSASYGHIAGRIHNEMVVQSLACRLGEKVRFEISPEALERELSVDGADVEAIARKYWTPPYSRESCTEQGGVEAVRGWIGEVEIDEALRDSLSGLVNRLGEGVEYAREVERVFEVTERGMYGWDPMPRPKGGRHGLPNWLRRWRGALAFVARDGREVPLVLADDETLPEAVRGEPVVFRPMGLANRDEKRALTDRFGAFPVAWVGAEAHHALVIRAREEDVQRLYLVDTRRLYRWAFEPWQTVAFEGPNGLMDALEGPAGDVEGRLAELGTRPPDVAAPRGERITMSAEAAREHVAEVEVDAELADALTRLIDEIDTCGFVREETRRVEFDEVMHQARFPAWYRQWRATLALPAAPESSASGTRIRLRFRAGSWQAGQGYSDSNWVMTPSGVHQDHLRHRLIDRYGVLPVAHETHKILGIRLDGGDQTIYSFDPSLYGADEDFDPFESPAFSGPAQLVDAIEAVGAGGEWVERA